METKKPRQRIKKGLVRGMGLRDRMTNKELLTHTTKKERKQIKEVLERAREDKKSNSKKVKGVKE